MYGNIPQYILCIYAGTHRFRWAVPTPCSESCLYYIIKQTKTQTSPLLIVYMYIYLCRKIHIVRRTVTGVSVLVQHALYVQLSAYANVTLYRFTSDMFNNKVCIFRGYAFITGLHEFANTVYCFTSYLF